MKNVSEKPKIEKVYEGGGVMLFTEDVSDDPKAPSTLKKSRKKISSLKKNIITQNTD